MGAVEGWARDVGQRAGVVQTFVPWLYPKDEGATLFPAGRAREIAAVGSELEVTWTPADPTEGEDADGIPLAAIAAGDYDAYVERFALDVKSAGMPVRLRFAHEMNGTWSRWSQTRPQNAPGDFVRAWRHIHDVFAAEGVANVTWVWSPNVVDRNTQPLAMLYPGDDYVDEVGIDGYSRAANGCPSPDELFDATLEEVRTVSTRPVALAEVGVSSACPDRAQWVADAYTWVQAEDLVGLTWWERAAGEDDYRIVPDAATLGELRQSLALDPQVVID